MDDDLIYLDHNATTPVDTRVREAMQPYLGAEYGNPSSLYRLAKRAEQAREQAREQVADLLGASPAEIVFTGCGTEADNMAIKGIGYANRDRGNHIIASEIEHHAVLNACKWMEEQGFEVTYLEVDENGRVDLDQLKSEITEETILISIMHANNEVGTIQPLEKIGEIAARNDIYLHTDAVQTVGKITFTVDELNVDLLALSAHKIYGPKGVGALYIREGTKIDSLLHGGHHENDRRAGTENMAGIVGLGKAAELSTSEQARAPEIEKLRDRLEAGLLEEIDAVTLNGHPDKRLANTLNICVEYIEGESMLLRLDHENIAASSGSACTSGTLDPSHVLTAMGIPPELAHGSLRFSLGRENTEAEIDRVIEVLPGIVEQLRAMSPLYDRDKT